MIDTGGVFEINMNHLVILPADGQRKSEVADVIHGSLTSGRSDTCMR